MNIIFMSAIAILTFILLGVTFEILFPINNDSNIDK